MKSRYFTVRFITVVLALMITSLVPAISVRADEPGLELSKNNVPAGTGITLSGEDFSPGFNYYLFFDDSFKSKGVINVHGEFSQSLTIPSAAENGLHEIKVGATPEIIGPPDVNFIFEEEVYAEIEVTGSQIEIQPENGKAGTLVTLKGSNFNTKYYYVFFDEDFKNQGEVGSDGRFSCKSGIPSDAEERIHKIIVKGSNSQHFYPDIEDNYDQQVSTEFEVSSLEPEIELDNNLGKVGDIFQLSGSEFADNRYITVYWDNQTLGSPFLSDETGAFKGKEFRVPESCFGSHIVKAVDVKGNYGSLGYSVIPQISLSRTEITWGDTITVSGKGFKDNSALTFLIDSTELKVKAISSNKGTLSPIEVKIPEFDPDKYTFKVKDEEEYSARVDIQIKKESKPGNTASSINSTPTAPVTPAETQPCSDINNQQPSTLPEKTSAGIPVRLIIVIIVLILAAGALTVILVIRKRKHPK